MNEIDVRTVRARRLEAMEEIARLEHRRIERFAVERHQRARAAKILRNDAEHGALAGEIGHQMLFGDEAALLVEPTASNEKSVSACAAVEAGGFEVEKDEGHRCRRSPDERSRWRGCL